ncbi:hypothetical protein C0585_02025 [Candidatus Woesearchaeota archaeon]|nr:MAG: hypothetical protein C0585_02025 [Candidatus Woesearchaeota archaeon]
MNGIEKIISSSDLNKNKISPLLNHLKSYDYNNEVPKFGKILRYISKNEEYTFSDLKKIVLSFKNSEFYNSLGNISESIVNNYIMSSVLKKNKRKKIRESDTFYLDCINCISIH